MTVDQPVSTADTTQVAIIKVTSLFRFAALIFPIPALCLIAESTWWMLLKDSYQANSGCPSFLYGGDTGQPHVTCVEALVHAMTPFRAALVLSLLILEGLFIVLSRSETAAAKVADFIRRYKLVALVNVAALCVMLYSLSMAVDWAVSYATKWPYLMK